MATKDNTLTTYFSLTRKKRPHNDGEKLVSSSPSQQQQRGKKMAKMESESTTPPQQFCSSPVKFTQKGMLSPVKKRGGDVGVSQPKMAALKKCRKLEELKAALGKWEESKRGRAVGGIGGVSGVSGGAGGGGGATEAISSNQFYSPEKKKISSSTPPPAAAFKRYRHLVDKTPPLDQKNTTTVETATTTGTPPGLLLPLPHNYKVLLHLFEATTTILHLESRKTGHHHHPGTTPTGNHPPPLPLPQLRPLVSTLNPALPKLTVRHFAQFATISPETFKITRSNDNVIHVSMATNSPPSITTTFEKAKFRTALTTHLATAHLNFLKSRGYLSNEDDLQGKPVTRLHPEFVAGEIEQAENVIPKIVAMEKEKISTAKELLERVKGLVGENSEFKKKKKISMETKMAATTTKIKKPITKTTTEIKSVSNALLAKIRARESAKLVKALTKTPDEVAMEKLENLKSEFLVVMDNYFLTEGKRGLPLGVVKDKLGECLQCEAHLIDRFFQKKEKEDGGHFLSGKYQVRNLSSGEFVVRL